MTVTNHAKQRAKERCGINKKSTERIASEAPTTLNGWGF